MKLYYSPTSPYACKVRILVRERGLEQAVQEVSVNPLDPDAPIPVPGPLGKVPVLVTDEGQVFFDSPVICAFLDQQGEAAALLPLSGPARWGVERAQALGDGLIDAAVSLVMEGRRPATERSSYWQARWQGVIERVLPVIAHGLEAHGQGVDLGHISWLCALGYLDFRLPAIDWRKDFPDMARWADAMASRPALAATVLG